MGKLFRPGARSRDRRSPANAGIAALALLSGALVLGLLAWETARERIERIEREKEALARMAQVVASETEGLFSRIRLFFASADLWLATNPSVDPRTDPAFARLVDTFRSVGKERIDIRLVSETGGLYYIPSASSLPLADLGDRDYFIAQASPATRGFFVGIPILGRVSKTWTIPVSCPLKSRNAGVSVIFAAIEIPIIEEFYDAIRPKPNGAVTLIRGDGIILARSPFDETVLGKPIVPNLAAWRKSIAATPASASVIRTASTDNRLRILAYDALDSPGFVISITSRLSEVLAVWESGLWWRGLMALIMLAAIATISAGLRRALGRLELAQSELKAKLELLRKSDATKDKLFSLVAHDLRGPIGGMSNLLETLATDRGDMKPETIDEFIAALRLTSWNTYHLLENLLSWSRSARGEMPFSPERLIVSPLIEGSEQLFALSIAQKGLTIKAEVEEGLVARADPELAKVIFRNLISNAVKFTPRGGTILVAARREGGGIRVIVRDEGIGMDGEQLGALFDLGATRSRSGTANERGSGLGLVLCKEMLELHGGSIKVESEVGKGSSFSIYLPD
jgi:signal transduction histidine kinase